MSRGVLKAGWRPALLFFLVLAGCRGPMTGHSAYEVLPPPAAIGPAAKQIEGEQRADLWINPIAASTRGAPAQPEYPADALAAKAGEQVIFVTVSIDENGKVREVVPSWGRVSVPNKFTAAFVAAVQKAVATWEIEPARNVYWQKGPAGEDLYLRTEKIPARFELKFTFTATGGVR